ncbi:HMG domain-containing protein 4a [Polyodon spathula]|uniref:HMG domain-containing protein 4a n=1 Tax=Polyodon spathula TaxID=7913 RepID=UPI001B7EB70D|nr:HMG domain-containing protein 4a [Polyodon spathula]
MAFEEVKKKAGTEGAVLECGGIEEVGLVAGRSQREKKRSYKDLLREEEEIAAQVRKSSKKRGKDSEFYLGGGDSHKKRKKQHSTDEFHCGDFSPSHSSKKKQQKPAPPVPPPSLRDTDTAMGLLKAITSPLATGSKPASAGGGTGGGSGGGSGRSHPHKPAYPPSHKHSHHHGKHSGKGSPKLNQRHPKKTGRQGEAPKTAGTEGLKVKLILSPKEKGEGERGAGLGYPSPHSAGGNPKKSLKKLSRDGAAGGGGGGGVATVLVSKTVKKKHTKEPLPAVGEEIEVEGRFEPGFYGDVPGLGVLSQGIPLAESGSSSGGELEAGELVIDDSYREVHSSSSSKKKKKSKKSKKKKEREREKERGEKHKGERKHSKKTSGQGHAPGHAPSTGASLLSPEHAHPLSTPNHGAAGGGVYPGATPTSGSGGGVYLMARPTVFPHHAGESQSEGKKKKKLKEEKDDKEKPRKKNMTAYQVFCKEYRVNINSLSLPSLVFGELSRKLADVWKQLPEKDKLVWKQKAQYLQHKQNKAEATTVKRKSAGSDGCAPKTKGPSSRVATPHRKSPSGGVSLSLSPARLPDSDPIDVAAHLQLLGESLSLIGHRLQETEGMVAVSGSLSVLLDSILCALGPLTCLTAHVPEINGCPKPVLVSHCVRVCVCVCVVCCSNCSRYTLDNVAY